MIMRTLLKEANWKIKKVTEVENPDSEIQNRDFFIIW